MTTFTILRVCICDQCPHDVFHDSQAHLTQRDMHSFPNIGQNTLKCLLSIVVGGAAIYFVSYLIPRGMGLQMQCPRNTVDLLPWHAPGYLTRTVDKTYFFDYIAPILIILYGHSGSGDDPDQ